MSIVGLLILLVIVGAALYFLQLIPLDDTVKQIIRGVVILVVVIYVILFLAGLFGLASGVPAVKLR